ncbi:proteasome assembly chaperone 4 isoform X2 [Stigmatopora nigra]
MMDSISIHNFSEKFMELTVHFHVMKLSGAFFLWVGSSPLLSNLAVSMSSRYGSMPLSTLVMGDPSNTATNSLAQRLGAWVLLEPIPANYGHQAGDTSQSQGTRR